MSSSKRASTMPSGPKTPTNLSSSLTIADNTSMVGGHLITLGSNTVVHPRTKFNSTHAPITVGSMCIISERCQMGFQSVPGIGGLDGTTIENGVMIEAGAVVEANRVGEGCVIDVGAKIGKGAVLGKHCKIGAFCEVLEDEVLPDFTVLFGQGMRRIDRSETGELRLKLMSRQVEALRKIIPGNLAKFR